MKKRLCYLLCVMQCMVLLFSCNAVSDIHELYTITDNGDYTYDYVIKDKHNHVLLEDKGIIREPEIRVINNDVLSISVQTGTGISTRWTVYCDVNSGTISDTYYAVLGEYDEKVVYANYENGVHSVVVHRIFNRQQDLKKFVLEDAINRPDPIVDFEIGEDGKATIVYSKGADCAESKMTIELY